jgi:hypothetical protein
MGALVSLCMKAMGQACASEMGACMVQMHGCMVQALCCASCICC